MLKNKLKLSNKVLIPFVFFLSFYIIGLSVYKDYGLSWDEHAQRVTGVVSALYINGKLGNAFISEEAIKQKLSAQRQQTSEFSEESEEEIENRAIKFDKETLKDYRNKDYGVAFQLILIGAEAVMGTSDTRDVYFLRHLLTFSFFFVSTVFFYFLSYEIFKKWYWGLLSVLFLLLSPRIFAHSFYNSKDLVFMGAFMMASYTLLKFIQKPNLKYIILHALFSAFLIGIRIPGIIIIVISVFFLILNFFQQNYQRQYVKTGLNITSYVLLTLSFTILFWPTLWDNPLYILDSFSNMSKFRWEGYVMYFGDLIRASNLPWHYIILWIGISTPLIFLALFVFSFISFLILLVKNKTIFYDNGEERVKWLIFALFFIPLLALIVKKPILYGAWRHAFFIYPAFILISIMGIKDIIDNHIKSIKYKKPVLIGIVALITLNLSFVLAFMIRNHPYQNMYFNVLAGNNIEGNFDRDYWGLSYRDALEKLLKIKKSGKIKVYADFGSPASLNAMVLTKEQRSRIQFSSLKEASYYITTDTSIEMQGEKVDKYYKEKYGINSKNEIANIKVDNIKIHKIYKLK